MFYPNVEKFHSGSVLIAVGHAFFTLSLGMATIISYAASLDKNVNIVKASMIVVIMDTLIALVAGVIIFSIIFNAGEEPWTRCRIGLYYVACDFLSNRRHRKYFGNCFFYCTRFCCHYVCHLDIRTYGYVSD